MSSASRATAYRIASFWPQARPRAQRQRSWLRSMPPPQRGAEFGDVDGLFGAGAEAGDRAFDAGDDVAGSVDDDVVSEHQAAAGDVGRVVQGGVGDGGAGDVHRVEDGARGDHAGAAHAPLHGAQHGDLLGGGELEGGDPLTSCRPGPGACSAVSVAGVGGGPGQPAVLTSRSVSGADPSIASWRSRVLSSPVLTSIRRG